MDAQALLGSEDDYLRAMVGAIVEATLEAEMTSALGAEVAALAEMYAQGVSTRKVKAITEELRGHAFSASSISEINKKLDGELAAFASRRLEEAYPYLIVDARYREGRVT